ncbi:MAG: 16S rRNA (guanine(966)-N(2))-methyltransferase RsmD [Candidatus Planktophila sp.]
MRIIAGLAKGRNISAVAESTRPTSDRAREALFSSLASEFGDFDGLNVLDLYAGTGAIGLEALSRGSSTVHCVESDERAAQAIFSNYESIKSSQFPGIFHLYSMSVDRFLENPAPMQYHFIYVDPPYEFSDIDIIENLIAIVDGNFLHPDGLIAVERNSRVKELSWPYGLEQLRDKKYGQATIFFGVPTLEMDLD